MRNSRIEVRPIAGACGAEIDGVRIGDDLDDATIGEIRQALNEHCVIFFRDQEFDAEQHKAFARRFGEIFVHPNYRGMQDDDEIVMVRREPGDKHIVGEDWHTDTTMVAAPPMGAILYAIEVPPYGGDTCFANQYLAYEALSAGMKRMLEGIAGGAQRPHGRRAPGRPQRPSLDQGARGCRVARDGQHSSGGAHASRDRPQAAVRQRPYTVGFEGMTEAESRPLLDYLLEHGHRPEFTCRFRWENGSVAFWDNRSVKHLAVHDAGPFRRLMRRIQIAGDVPY